MSFARFINISTLQTSVSETVNKGQATIEFPNFQTEGVVSVIGQDRILESSNVVVTLNADNDDVYATDWNMPIVCNLVPNVGFDIVLRPRVGRFKGSVKVSFQWA